VVVLANDASTIEVAEVWMVPPRCRGPPGDVGTEAHPTERQATAIVMLASSRARLVMFEQPKQTRHHPREPIAGAGVPENSWPLVGAAEHPSAI
jgi:hypothetical protein